jgi:hypothetical protein
LLLSGAELKIFPERTRIMMSFGQVLPIATFVPVLGEAAYIWQKGTKRALTGLMMGPYEAVIPEEEEDHTEKAKTYPGPESSNEEPMSGEDEAGQERRRTANVA